MLQSLFIVWRESVEALLVIGILYAWLRHRPDPARGLRMLWGGTALGLLLACLLALLFMLAGEWLAGPAGEWFQAAMVFCASLLILQMVVWMHRHGSGMKRSLESSAAQSMQQGGGWGLLLLAMLAVAREGSETVVFLYGIGAQQQGAGLGYFALGGALGFVLALLTFAVLQLSSRVMSWRRFFQVSEVVLLLLGGALLMAALDRVAGQLMGMDVPEWVYGAFGDPLWDTSALLSDGHGLGATLAGFAGYRAAPSLAAVLALALYWALAGFCCLRRERAPEVQPA
ncbi:Ferrous iron permease EfeU [compost metagenome]